MFKAFDTLDRKKLIDILRRRGTGEKNVTIIKPLLIRTTLRAKNGKSIGEPFNNNRGVPKKDGLSPRIFTQYLDEALGEIDRDLGTDAPKGREPQIHDPDYAKKKQGPDTQTFVIC